MDEGEISPIGEAVHNLPPGYYQAEYISIMDPGVLVKLNLWSLGLLVIALVFVVAWSAVVGLLRGPFTASDPPSALSWLAVIMVLPLHEWVHGLAIRWAGHRPRYGMKGVRVRRWLYIPYALYATTDDALFPRDTFVVIALAPLIAISIAGMALMLALPDPYLFYIAAALVINATGAVGDLWMTVVVRRYPPDTLVQDEADSVRIFARGEGE